MSWSDIWTEVRDYFLEPLASVPYVQSKLPKLGWDINKKDSEGWTLLEHAANRGDAQFVGNLIKAGVKLDFSTVHSAMRLATFKGNNAVLQRLYDTRVKVKGLLSVLANADYEDSYTHSEKVVTTLLKNGEQINGEKGDRETPLHAASRSQKLELVKLLCAKGADLFAKNAEGETPRQIAGSDDIAKYLERAEKIQKIRNQEGSSNKANNSDRIQFSKTDKKPALLTKYSTTKKGPAKSTQKETARISNSSSRTRKCAQK